MHRFDSKLISTFGESRNVEVSPSLVLIPRTFGTIGTLEHLEPALVFNGLNEPQSVDWNDWNV